MKRLLIIVSTAWMGLIATWAQDEIPTIDPIGVFTTSDGTTEEGTTYSGSAPLTARFKANPENVGSWDAYYEWRFTKLSEESADHTPYLIRYEEETEYTFSDAGSHNIVCYAIFTQDNDTIEYTEDYWSEIGPLTVTISESKLIMPNAFSPNGDQYNEVYKAKEYQSLVEFRAIIFNRWGQKVYEWNDPAGGWDGTFNGHDAKEGTYFVDVKAKGADGRTYHIKRDVNLLRGYTETNSSSTATE